MGVDLVERFQPFIGAWISEAAGPGIASRLACRRDVFASPGGSFVVMVVSWPTTSPMYEEVVTFATGANGQILFTSATPDHLRSAGREADLEGGHSDGLVFEIRMPEGSSRLIYRSEGEDAFYLAVENEATGGWSRYMEHRYRRIPPAT
jgi:hypothetical protein